MARHTFHPRGTMSRKIGEQLVREGLLSPTQLAQALDAQQRSGGTIGSQLLALGLVSEDALTRALARVTGLPAVSRAELFAAPPEIVGLLSANFARRHRALPFRVEGERLLLAVDDPADNAALDEAAFLTGFSISPYVAAEAVLRAALAHHHGPAPVAAPVAPLPPPGGPFSAVAEESSDQEAETGPTGSLDEAEPPEDGATNVIEPEEPPARAPEPVAVAPAAPARSYPSVPAAPSSTPADVGPGAIAAPADWSEIGRRLADATDRDDIIDIAADAVELLLPRALVFAVRGDHAVAVKTRGLPDRLPRELSVPLDDAGVLGPALGGRLQYGPIQLGPAERDFYTLLGGRAPTAALVVPVALRGRTVLVLYGDDPGHTRAAPAFDDARRLGSLVGAAVEIAVLRARILREAGAS